MFARQRLARLAALAAPALALSVANAAWAGQDRYGPPAVQDQAPASGPSPVGYLSWPSKTTISTSSAAPVAAATPDAVQTPEPLRSGPARALPTSVYAPTPTRYAPAPIHGGPRASLTARSLRPAETVAAMQRSAPPQRFASINPQRPMPPASAPASVRAATPLEAAPPAANPQPDAVSANGAPPRFYSVQRQFGVTPEQAPLQAQFFADAASTDLAGPPPPPAPHLIPGQSASSAANVQRANAAANIADGDPTTSN